MSSTLKIVFSADGKIPVPVEFSFHDSTDAYVFIADVVNNISDIGQLVGVSIDGIDFDHVANELLKNSGL